MDMESKEDQRKELRQEPNLPCTVETLRELGVISWVLDADNYEEDEKLQAIRDVRSYSFRDVITVSPDKLPGYEEKIKCFFEVWP